MARSRSSSGVDAGIARAARPPRRLEHARQVGVALAGSRRARPGWPPARPAPRGGGRRPGRRRACAPPSTSTRRARRARRRSAAARGGRARRARAPWACGPLGELAEVDPVGAPGLLAPARGRAAPRRSAERARPRSTRLCRDLLSVNTQDGRVATRGSSPRPGWSTTTRSTARRPGTRSRAQGTRPPCGTRSCASGMRGVFIGTLCIRHTGRQPPWSSRVGGGPGGGDRPRSQPSAQPM